MKFISRTYRKNYTHLASNSGLLIISMCKLYSFKAQFGCVRGVLHTRVGFSGGSTPSPTYRTIGRYTTHGIIFRGEDRFCSL